MKTSIKKIVGGLALAGAFSGCTEGDVPNESKIHPVYGYPNGVVTGRKSAGERIFSIYPEVPSSKVAYNTSPKSDFTASIYYIDDGGSQQRNLNINGVEGHVNIVCYPNFPSYSCGIDERFSINFWKSPTGRLMQTNFVNLNEPQKAKIREANLKIDTILNRYGGKLIN